MIRSRTRSGIIWSARAETFDQSAGHGVRSDCELKAWARLLEAHFEGSRVEFEGSCVEKVLELASGTGQITRVLLSMNRRVTGLDLSETTIGKASERHRGALGQVQFHMGDAENTMMPDSAFDAVVSRHLVWTLPDPAAAFADWMRVLKPGGRVVVIDGDWVRAPKRPLAKLSIALVNLLNRLRGEKPHSDPDTHTHQDIPSQVCFAEAPEAV